MTQSGRYTYITNGNVITDQGIVFGGSVLLRNRVIERVYAAGEKPGIPPELCEIYQADGNWIIPGFIDVHVHGGAGLDFMAADASTARQICQFHARHGTTGLLVTTVSAPHEQLDAVLQQTHRMIPSFGHSCAQILGVHLEGPFLNADWAGAHNPAHLQLPRADWIQEWALLYPAVIRMVTLAPELQGAMPLIRWMDRQGIVASCGHTGASYQEMTEAVNNGLRHAVHFFNAMTGLHHREPGTVGAILSAPGVSAEIIADGHHVHPACIKLLAEVKPTDKLLLITDAISAAGHADGDYSIGGTDITVADGVARVKGTNHLAGSTLTMMKAVGYMVNTVGISVEAASRMASGNPAKLLGLYHTIGSIREGKDADILAVGIDLELKHVWIKGQRLTTGDL